MEPSYQAFVVQSMMATNDIIRIDLQLCMVTPFDLVTDAFKFEPQSVQFPLPVTSPVIACPFFQPTVGHLNIDSLNEKLDESQRELFDLSLMALGLFDDSFYDILREDMIIIHDGVLKLLKTVVEITFVLVDEVAFFGLASLALNLVDSVEVAFICTGLSFVVSIADYKCAPDYGVLQVLEFRNDDIKLIVHFFKLLFLEVHFR